MEALFLLFWPLTIFVAYKFIVLNINQLEKIEGKKCGLWARNRTYDNTIALRAVEAIDGMTARFSRLNFDFLERVSNRIINEVEGINRVVYDISSKPPATIEWE